MQQRGTAAGPLHDRNPTLTAQKRPGMSRAWCLEVCDEHDEGAHPRVGEP